MSRSRKKYVIQHHAIKKLLLKTYCGHEISAWNDTCSALDELKFRSYNTRNITFSKIAIRYWNIIIVWKLISYFFFLSRSVCNTQFLYKFKKNSTCRSSIAAGVLGNRKKTTRRMICYFRFPFISAFVVDYNIPNYLFGRSSWRLFIYE